MLFPFSQSDNEGFMFWILLGVVIWWLEYYFGFVTYAFRHMDD